MSTKLGSEDKGIRKPKFVTMTQISFFPFFLSVLHQLTSFFLGKPREKICRQLN